MLTVSYLIEAASCPCSVALLQAVGPSRIGDDVNFVDLVSITPSAPSPVGTTFVLVYEGGPFLPAQNVNFSFDLICSDRDGTQTSRQFSFTLAVAGDCSG